MSEVDTATDVIDAMLRSLEFNYVKRDWTQQICCQKTGEVANAYCRSAMVAWCFQIVDFLKLHRDTVEIATSYLDRFLATPAGEAALQDRSAFQKVFMTCLYTAVKIHEPVAMDTNLVSFLSSGAFTSAEIEAMEFDILSALDWKLNPPTANAFLYRFLDLIPSSLLDEEERTVILALTKKQIDFSISQPQYISKKASHIAYCALINTLEALNAFQDETKLGLVQCELATLIGINCNDSKLIAIQNHFFEEVLALERRQKPKILSCQACEEQKTKDYSQERKRSSIARRDSLHESPRAISEYR